MLTEAVLEALPVGIAVVDAARRLVLFNAAYHDSLDMPPNSFYRGMSVADALRVAAYRGVYGPGDPEAQIAAFLKTDRARHGRLRRRSHNGRSFDVLQAPLPDGGYVVCAIETTSLVAARAGAEKALGRVMATLATLRTGLAAFGPDGALLFANPSFGDLFGLTPDQPPKVSGSPNCWTCWPRATSTADWTARHSSPRSACWTAHGPRQCDGCVPTDWSSTSSPIHCPMAAGP
jgi:PAS domain-containing protein